MGWGLHPLIYKEKFSSLVDVGSPTQIVNILNIFIPTKEIDFCF